MQAAVRSVLPEARDVNPPHRYVSVLSDELCSPCCEAGLEPASESPLLLPREPLRLLKSWRRRATVLVLLGAVVAAAFLSSRGGPLISRGGGLEGKSLVPISGGILEPHKVCAGDVEVAGLGSMALINAAWNKPNDTAGRVRASRGVRAHMKGRSYFADSCADGPYSNREYASLRLLNKTFSYHVDLSAARCGCNAALYLTSMSKSSNRSSCGDYYCDAAKVCGVSCAEIDIQEANAYAWWSTMHAEDDLPGLGGGYGASRLTWNSSQYGPHGRCIDTLRPFAVAASFPTHRNGSLAAFEVALTQSGQPCSLSVRIDSYSPLGRKGGLEELTGALRDGMTPVISYWGIGEDLQWMDGLGPDSQGPCAVDTPEMCGESVQFWGFAVS